MKVTPGTVQRIDTCLAAAATLCAAWWLFVSYDDWVLVNGGLLSAFWFGLKLGVHLQRKVSDA